MARWRRRYGAAGVLALVALACLPGPAHSTVAAVAVEAAPRAEAAGVPADGHLRAAQRQSRGQPALAALVRRACAPAAAPGTSALAAQALAQVEAAHRAERALQRPQADRLLQALAQVEADHRAERALQRPQADRLLQAVVLRNCAAYHATRLQSGTSHPVWWHTRLRIDSVRPAATGFAVQASASTVIGPVASSRVTFARGLHHACFASTDVAGQAACAMVDTHPHGGRPDAWAEAHEGPIIATFAGSVSPSRVELPAVEVRNLPVFAGAPAWR